MKKQELQRGLRILLLTQELTQVEPYTVSISNGGFDIDLQGRFTSEVTRKLHGNPKWTLEIDVSGFQNFTRRITLNV